MIVRFILFFALVVGVFLLPWWGALVLVLPYVYLYRAPEVPVAMILIDGYIGTLSFAPVLSVAGVGIFILSEALRPYLVRWHSL